LSGGPEKDRPGYDLPMEFESQYVFSSVMKVALWFPLSPNYFQSLTIAYEFLQQLSDDS